MIEKLRIYWAAREPREQLLLAVCAFCVIAGLLYLLWAPLAKERDRLDKRLPQLKQDAARMQQLTRRWSGGQAAQQDWHTATQTRLNAFGLSTKAKLISTDEQTQRWQFDNCSANAFLDWISSLYNDFGLRVKTIQINPQSPGYISATLEIHHP